MKQWIEIWNTQKEIIIWNGASKKSFDHFKLKLWTFFWGQGEHEWPLVCMVLKRFYYANLENGSITWNDELR